MAITPIIGTLIYVTDDQNNSVLMVHRTARPDDEHLGKYNGLGGKVESGEDIVLSARREVKEEAQLELNEITLRGTVVWSGFGPQQQDWLGFIFTAKAPQTAVPQRNEEGTLVWVSQQRLLQACSPNSETRAAVQLPMWDGDRYFLPLVFDDDPKVFHGVMAYTGDTATSWSYHRI